MDVAEEVLGRSKDISALCRQQSLRMVRWNCNFSFEYVPEGFCSECHSLAVLAFSRLNSVLFFGLVYRPDNTPALHTGCHSGSQDAALLSTYAPHLLL